MSASRAASAKILGPPPPMRRGGRGRCTGRGSPSSSLDAAVSNSLKAAEVKVDLACRLGKAAATVWTCDLSKDYVTINADYHT